MDKEFIRLRNKGLIRLKSEAGQLFYERKIVNYGSRKT
jgi:hypothetical protein